ncbi:MAG: MBL fold metallo-hydrolase [Methanotrichaceae archaeon]|nr:MBL fold metallo-hydrolase [Methanotrichaceae archaeon]
MVSLTVYDGANGIGGNKIYLEENSQGVFLDFGKNFGKYGAFYEEFLKSRDTRGIHDLVYLGLLPKLNIYRPDLIPSDLSLAQFPALNITAVLLSHAHMDHAGNLGVLRKEIPIIASPESIVIMKGMQDTGTSSIESDTTYFSMRQPGDILGLYLESVALKNYIGKDLYCTEPLTDGLLSFLSSRPGQDSPKARKKLEPGKCADYKDATLPFEVSAHPVDHSLLGATAYLLRGDTTIAYTGDFRLHGKNGESTRKFVNQAKDASVLIIEGTRAGPSSGEEKVTEQSVSNVCQESVESSTGLVIADFSARNFERLETFQEIAQKTNRDLVVTAKDAYMLHSLGCVDGVCKTESLKIYKEITNKTRRKWESEVVKQFCGGQYVDHTTIRNNPSGYILCFSFFDMKHLLDIKPNGGTYIYSSCEAFNEEMEIDFRRLWQWLSRFNISPCGFSMEKVEGGDYELSFDNRYHASGHASGEDIAWVIDQIDPDHIIPVHTEARDWFAKSFENVILVEEGLSSNL